MSRHSGFTLIEMAFVLVIAGLLLGGALKSQSLIESARTRNLIQDGNAYAAAIEIYRDRYRHIPGDDPGANAARGSAWENAKSNSQTLGNGKLDEAERGQMWNQLRAASLVNGEITLDEAKLEPRHAFGSKVIATQGAVGMNNLAICFENIPGSAASAIDEKIDDGKANAGSVRSTGSSINAANEPTVAATAYSEDKSYTVCRAV